MATGERCVLSVHTSPSNSRRHRSVRSTTLRAETEMATQAEPQDFQTFLGP